MVDISPASEPDPRVLEFQRRLAHIDRSYREAVKLEAATGSYNESLGNLAKALNPRARRKQNPVRLHPYLEMMIKVRWLKRNADKGPNEKARMPTPTEIREICEELTAELKPTRGRPADPNLTYHVHALMVLVEETCGKPAEAMRFKNSVYDPQMSSVGGRVVELIFRNINDAITTTQLANIIRDAHSSGALEGKRFRDFFPFYGGHVDPETGNPVPGPGYKLVSFEPTHPIYCS